MTFTKEKLEMLDETLTETCHTERIPGMAMIVSQDGANCFEKFYGHRDVERELPVTGDTIFGVASITKSFVALAIMQLDDAGKLTVDDPVVYWLPEFKLPNHEYTKRVTIHHLLTHTSGMPGLDAVNKARAQSMERDPDGAYLFGEIPSTERPVKTVSDVMNSMARTDYKLLGAPGEVFNYSNESYALLQGIIERASGESFITYMASHILHPLQMERSMFLLDDLTQQANVTELYAYTKDKERTVFHSPVWWDVGEIYANGSLKASVRGLMTYLEVYRLGGLVNGKRIVSEKSIQKMLHPQVTLPNGIQYGYGLQLRSESGFRFAGHGGGIKGVSSTIQFAVDEGLTICVLTNIADAPAEDLAMTAMNNLLDAEKPAALPEYRMTVEQLHTYAGHYQSQEGKELHAVMDDGKLHMQQEGDLIELRPYAADQFVMPGGKKLIFTVDTKRDVTGVFQGMRWLPKV